MSAPVSVFPQDRSQRWTLVPGVASARQIQIRNDSDSSVECHLSVDSPSSASASPAVVTIPPRHARTADIIFLADWSPAHDQRVVVSVRDAQGNPFATFSHEVTAADSSDCAVVLAWKDEILLNGTLAGFKLWCSLTSRSTTARTFEVEFTPHPALRFPERKTVTLAPSESAAFEVPVEWNRSVRDLQGWNHPRVIEVSVPMTEGRRAAVMLWDSIEKHLDRHLTSEDREQKLLPPEPVQPRRPTLFEKTPGQLKYDELVELKRLEQGVVGAPQTRTITPGAEAQRRSSRRVPVGPLALTGIALAALAVAAFFYLRPPESRTASALLHVTPLRLSLPAPAHGGIKPLTQPLARAAATTQASRAVVESTTGGATAVVLASTEGRNARSLPHKTVALAPQRPPQRPPAINREAVVALGSVAANYASDGRAVNIAWSGAAQARATVELLNDHGKVIASRSVSGGRSDAVVRLPRGYHGPVYVEVIAIGYHGERVVQSASLLPGG